MQRHGCRALGNLASSGSRAVLAVEGAVAAVVAALRDLTSEFVQQHGCRALARLTRSKEGQQAVLAVDGSVAALVAVRAASYGPCADAGSIGGEGNVHRDIVESRGVAAFASQKGVSDARPAREGHIGESELGAGAADKGCGEDRSCVGIRPAVCDHNVEDSGHSAAARVMRK